MSTSRLLTHCPPDNSVPPPINKYATAPRRLFFTKSCTKMTFFTSQISVYTDICGKKTLLWRATVTRARVCYPARRVSYFHVWSKGNRRRLHAGQRLLAPLHMEAPERINHRKRPSGRRKLSSRPYKNNEVGGPPRRVGAVHATKRVGVYLPSIE